MDKSASQIFDSASHISDNAALAHHRNRLAGLWAAELLGLIGHAAGDYVKAVMHPDHAPDAIHDDDAEQVEQKLRRDLAGRVSAAEIRTRMGHFLAEAKRQILHPGQKH